MSRGWKHKTPSFEQGIGVAVGEEFGAHLPMPFQIHAFKSSLGIMIR